MYTAKNIERCEWCNIFFWTTFCFIVFAGLGILFDLLLEGQRKSVIIWLFASLGIWILISANFGPKMYGRAYLVGGMEYVSFICLGAALIFIGSGTITAEYMRDSELWFYALGGILTILGTASAFFGIREGPVYGWDECWDE